MKYWNLIVGAGLLLIAAAGCQNYHEIGYITPAREVKDIAAVDALAISVNSKVSGNAFADNQLTWINGPLWQLVSSRFYDEGFYRTGDIIWGNPAGVARLKSDYADKNPRHGYVRMSTESIRFAALQIECDLKLETSSYKETRNFVIKDLPYRDVYQEQRLVATAPDYTRMVTNSVNVQSDVFKAVGSGSLKAVLTDKNGQKIYEKSFPLSYQLQISADKHGGLPPASEMILTMVMPAVEQVVADVSPHREVASVAYPGGGDSGIAKLINAHAYVEAAEASDAIRSKSAADYENQGFACEAIGEYSYALLCYQQSLSMSGDREFAKQGVERLQKMMAGKTLQRPAAKNN